MQFITRFFTTALELIEAEGRHFRRCLFDIGIALLLFMVAGLILVAGVLSIAAGIFIALQSQIGPVGAALVVGIGLLASAAVLAKRAHDMAKHFR